MLRVWPKYEHVFRGIFEGVEFELRMSCHDNKLQPVHINLIVCSMRHPVKRVCLHNANNKSEVSNQLTASGTN